MAISCDDDADGSMNPNEIVHFCRCVEKRLRFCQRFEFIPSGGTNDAPRHRLFGNWVLAVITNMLYRTHYTDVTYGYNALSRRCLEKIKLKSWGFSIETEMGDKSQKSRHENHRGTQFESPRISGMAKTEQLSGRLVNFENHRCPRGSAVKWQ